jgi:hypothetical protein
MQAAPNPDRLCSSERLFSCESFSDQSRCLMELNPALEFGRLNGWILLALEFLVQGISLLLIPKGVVARLFDRSGWSVKQRAFLILGSAPDDGPVQGFSAFQHPG